MIHINQKIVVVALCVTEMLNVVHIVARFGDTSSFRSSQFIISGLPGFHKSA